MKKEVCVSCSGKHQKPSDELHHTCRNEEMLPLCPACWRAALQVQRLLKSGESRAEAARKRYEARR